MLNVSRLCFRLKCTLAYNIIQVLVHKRNCAITIRTWIPIAIIILSAPTSSLDLVGLAGVTAGTGDRYTHKEMVISSHALDVALTCVNVVNVWVWCKAWSVNKIHLYYLQVLTVTVWTSPPSA